MIYWMLGLSATLFLSLVFLALLSRRPGALGLVNDRLRTCPDRPNCVNSEQKRNGAGTRPLAFEGAESEAWRAARRRG